MRNLLPVGTLRKLAQMRTRAPLLCDWEKEWMMQVARNSRMNARRLAIFHKRVCERKTYKQIAEEEKRKVSPCRVKQLLDRSWRDFNMEENCFHLRLQDIPPGWKLLFGHWRSKDG